MSFTLTKISENQAILFGGRHNRYFNHNLSWMLWYADSIGHWAKMVEKTDNLFSVDCTPVVQL